MVELLLIRHTVNLQRKCILVLPFVSIVTEKARHFRKLLADGNVEIGCFHSGARVVDTWDTAVYTIEKEPYFNETYLYQANSLINNMLEEISINKLGPRYLMRCI